MTVSDCARYECNVCGKEVHVASDKGLPEGWDSLVPTLERPDMTHICSVCLGPLEKVREVFRDARKVFLQACEEAGRGKVGGSQIARGLEGGWKNDRDELP